VYIVVMKSLTVIGNNSMAWCVQCLVMNHTQLLELAWLHFLKTQVSCPLQRQNFLLAAS